MSAFTAFAATASAQNFPAGPVKLIVRVPAGGVTDVMARVVASGCRRCGASRSSLRTGPGAITASVHRQSSGPYRRTDGSCGTELDFHGEIRRCSRS